MATQLTTGWQTNDIYEVEELEAWLQNNEMFLRACVVVVWAGGVGWWGGGVCACSGDSPRYARGHKFIEYGKHLITSLFI